jgi:hypothetical protein
MKHLATVGALSATILLFIHDFALNYHSAIFRNTHATSRYTGASSPRRQRHLP